MRALVMSEITQRVRGRRWWLLLILWTLVLFGLTWIVYTGMSRTGTGDAIGPPMFGALMLFTLALVCLVVPSLTSTSINGERNQGTFAVLQATMLRPAEIFAAKLVSGLIIAAAFLAATIPLTLWCMVEGGVALGRVLVTYALLLVVSGVFLSVGLATSTFLRRPALSAVSAYAAVFLLTIGTLIGFGLAMLTAPEREVRGQGFTTVESPVEWRWVLLSPNPFVVLADAAPRSQAGLADPLNGIRDLARTSRQSNADTSSGFLTGPEESPPAVWPTGLAIEALLTAGAAYATIRKLRIPAYKLAPGQRVA
jgi:ABC-2 type transport system permease protein